MDFARVLGVLHDHGARVVLVGGVAGRLHGAARMTDDIDFVYDRSDDNLDRLVNALAPYAPYLRGAPPGLPFEWSARTLRAGLNFTLQTTLGPIDLLGEITGGGRYENVLAQSIEGMVFGVPLRVLSLPSLIAVKRAAGRPKDLEAIAELELLSEEQGPSSR
jgi:predicted nucleotidyltransferase